MADPPRNDEPSRRMGQQGQVEEQAEEDLVDSPTVATTITVWQPSAVVYNSYPSNTGFPTHRYATSAPATAVVAVPRGFTLQGTQFQLGSVNTDRLAANNALQTQRSASALVVGFQALRVDGPSNISVGSAQVGMLESHVTGPIDQYNIQDGSSNQTTLCTPRDNQQVARPFQPSTMADPYWRIRRENPTLQDIAGRIAAGVSPNYRGDYTLARNRPANISSEQNCSVWITGLPPNVTVNMLLAAIRNTGRVWATVITPPTARYPTAAAKVTFFTAAAAQTLLARANNAILPGLIVNGRRASVQPDRNRVTEAVAPSDHTRVISIAGPRDIVTVENLTAFFSRSFVYELDMIDPLVLGQAINILEFHFGSYRCQAQWAWRNLRNNQFLQAQNVRIRFERDPCDWRG